MMRNRAYVATRLGPSVLDYLVWKRRTNAAEKTLDQYERDLRLVCLAHPGETVETMTHHHLGLVLDTVPIKSRRRVRAAWSDFFKWAVSEGYRLDNPVARLGKMPSVPDPVYDLWTQEELELLENGTRSMPYPLIERLRVRMMIESGGRAGELRALQLGHVDVSRKAVKLTGKGSKSRLVPVSGELCRLLDEHYMMLYPEAPHRQPLATDYLWFPTRRLRNGDLKFYPERPVGYGSFRRWWIRTMDAAGVRRRKPHMTRHSFATDLLDSGSNLNLVKDLLGHSSIRTTETYLHSSTMQMNEAVDRLNAYRRGVES